MSVIAQWQPYWQLARLDKTNWFTVTALANLMGAVAGIWGVPSFALILIFTAGVFVMRSAGCVINDYADRHFDGHVKRTASRPYPQAG